MLGKLIPKTMLGQMMLVLAVGLLVGQLVSASLLFRAAEQRRELTIVNELAIRFVIADRREERRESQRAGRASRSDRRSDGRDVIPPLRRLRLGIEKTEDDPVLAGDERFAKLEPLLIEALEEQGISASEVRVLKRSARSDPFLENRPIMRERLKNGRMKSRDIAVAAIKRGGTEQWEVARTFYRERRSEAIYTLAFQTVVIFAVLFALMYLMMRRVTRPLAILTRRVDAFSRNPDRPAPIEESGPQDTRQLIAAYNTMETRVAELLDEKDVMLGAIGHDLKTPLAALRVRIEGVEDTAQRERMAQSIEDITHTLDDILSLARIGRSGVEEERVDLSALAASVAEEFEDLGQPVTLGETTRLVRGVQVTWLKRALRNLVSNSVRYGGAAKVSVIETGGNAVLRIEDNGPGIPASQIADMLQPFRRGEESRNRATGGAGLGLTLARAIAEQHGGKLVLENRDEGGLRAEIRLP